MMKTDFRLYNIQCYFNKVTNGPTFEGQIDEETIKKTIITMALRFRIYPVYFKYLTGLWIRIHFLRIRIQRFFYADPDPAFEKL